MYSGRLDWKIEKEWSCPDHDYPDYGCECCGEGACELCEQADWEIIYDEDGWATLTFESESYVDRVLMEMYLPAIAEQLNTPSLLLHNLAGAALDMKVDLTREKYGD